MSDYASHAPSGILVSLEDLTASSMLAVDVESSGYHTGSDFPYGYSVTSDPGGSYFASVHDSFFGKLLADDSKLKIAHNAKYDRAMLKKAGIIADNWCDPMIAAHLLEAFALSLQYLVGVYLHEDIRTFTDLDKPLEHMTMQELADYSGPHAEKTLALWFVLQDRLKRLGLLNVFWGIEMPLIPVLSDMELNGVAVDINTLNLLGEEFDRKIEVLSKGLDYWSGHPGMNHNSPDQVADLLYNKLGVAPKEFSMTRSGSRPSVDKRILEHVKNQHSYIPMYLFFKELKTLKHSYVDSLKKQIVNGRIHGSFNQTRTSTSRLSGSDPNLQKIPERRPEGKKIRTAFVAPEGCKLIKADYKLIELVLLAHCSQDPAMLEAFRSGKDIHTETAIRVFGSANRRRDAKTLDFQIVYGGGGVALRNMFFKAYPGAKDWIDKTSIRLQQDLYARTLGGRIRTIEELDLYNSSRVIAHGVREGVSTIIQGSAAEEVKKGMVRIYKQLKNSDAKMVLQVHDEIVFEVPDRQVNDVVDVIWKTLPSNELSAPLKVAVEVGSNWGQLTEIQEGEKYVS